MYYHNGGPNTLPYLGLLWATMQTLTCQSYNQKPGFPEFTDEGDFYGKNGVCLRIHMGGACVMVLMMVNSGCHWDVSEKLNTLLLARC